MENTILPFRPRTTTTPVHPQIPRDTNASVAKLISPNLDPWLYMIQQNLKQGNNIFNPDFYKILLKYKILTIIPSGDDVDPEATVGVIDPENGAKFSVNIENMLLLGGVSVDAIEKDNFKLYVTNLLDASGIKYTIGEKPKQTHLNIKDIREFDPSAISIAAGTDQQWISHHSLCPDMKNPNDLLDVNSRNFEKPTDTPLFYMMIHYIINLKDCGHYPTQKSEVHIYKYESNDNITVIHLTHSQLYEIIRESIAKKWPILALNHKSTEELIEKVYEKYVIDQIRSPDKDNSYE